MIIQNSKNKFKFQDFEKNTSQHNKRSKRHEKMLPNQFNFLLKIRFVLMRKIVLREVTFRKYDYD